jgi:hypothetical protein
MMSRALIAAIVCVVTASCSDANDPSFPDLRSSYDASYRFVITDLATNRMETILCPGSMSVTSQRGESFSGSFAIQHIESGCPDDTGLVSGVVGADGKLTFRMTFSGSANNAIIEWTSEICAVTSGSDLFSGIFNSNKITASISANVRCPAGGGTFVNYSFQTHIVAVEL